MTLNQKEPKGYITFINDSIAKEPRMKIKITRPGQLRNASQIQEGKDTMGQKTNKGIKRIF